MVYHDGLLSGMELAIFLPLKTAYEITAYAVSGWI